MCSWAGLTRSGTSHTKEGVRLGDSSAVRLRTGMGSSSWCIGTIVLVLIIAHHARSSNAGRGRPFIPRLKPGGIRVAILVKRDRGTHDQPGQGVSLFANERI